MKKQPEPRRRSQLFVLTPEEKRVVAFVMLMILLGICVKEYRRRHPPTPVPAEVQKHSSFAKLPPLPSASPVPSITPRAADDIPADTPRAKRTRKSRKHSPLSGATPEHEESEGDSAAPYDDKPD